MSDSMSEMTAKEIAAIIHRNLGMSEVRSLRSIAKKIGLNPGHLSRILSGKRKLCLDTAFAICMSLDLSDDDSEELLFIAAKSEAEESIRKVQNRLNSSHFINHTVSSKLTLRLFTEYEIRPSDRENNL